MLKVILSAALMHSIPVTVHTETVYEFVAHCGPDELSPCFNRIEERLIELMQKEGGRAFCLPGGFAAGMLKDEGVPVSILEYIRVGLSAARFGRAERPVDEVITDIVSTVYPCQ